MTPISSSDAWYCGWESWTAPVTSDRIARSPNVVSLIFCPVSRLIVPAKNLTELVAWLKQNPGKGLIGTTGVGGASHLAAILFAKTIGAEVQIVFTKRLLNTWWEALSPAVRAAIGAAEESVAGNALVRQDADEPERRITVELDVRAVGDLRQPVPREQRQCDVGDLHHLRSSGTTKSL